MEELKVGDRVKFIWNWSEREGTVTAIYPEEIGDCDTLYEVEEVPGCNRMLFREEIAGKIE